MRARSVVLVVLGVAALVGVGVWAAVVALQPGNEPGGATASPTPSATTRAPGTTTTPRTTTTPSAATPSPDATDPAAPDDGTTPTAAPSAPPTGAPDQRQETAVTIVTADTAPSGDLEVGAFVAAIDDGGTCTLTATSGARTLSATTSAVPDATTTSCGALSLAAADLAPGTWRLAVAYESATLRGTSAPVQVTVR